MKRRLSALRYKLLKILPREGKLVCIYLYYIACYCAFSASLSSVLTTILFRWVLKCHACQNVTAEVGRVFCPKCGNGGTLRKVAVTVGENGVVLQARRHRINLRGTKVWF